MREILDGLTVVRGGGVQPPNIRIVGIVLCALCKKPGGTLRRTKPKGASNQEYHHRECPK